MSNDSNRFEQRWVEGVTSEVIAEVEEGVY